MLKRAEPRPAAGAAEPRPTPCWSCRGPVAAGLLFCPTCDAIQPPGQLDPFRRLGFAVGFDIDRDVLDRRYFEAQRRLHPDRFATRTPRERALSQQQATSVNEAYEALKDPLRRADTLIHMRGTDALPEGCNLINDQELLLETLELREALAEAETGAGVEALERRAGDDIARCVAELAEAFAADDLERASRLTTRLKYLRKLADETRVRRAQIAGSATP